MKLPAMFGRWIAVALLAVAMPAGAQNIVANSFAWGENIGWVNFSGGALATLAQPARFDPIAKRLRGYAWGENIGWINLDHSAVFVGMIFCPADFNGVNGVEVQDIFDFLAAWFAGDPRANFNGANGIEVQDIFDFLAAWFAGC